MKKGLQGGNPAKKTGITKLVPCCIKNFRIASFEYCIESSPSSGWQQTYTFWV